MFYVSIARAQKALHLFHARTRSGGRTYKAQSYALEGSQYSCQESLEIIVRNNTTLRSEECSPYAHRYNWLTAMQLSSRGEIRVNWGDQWALARF